MRCRSNAVEAFATDPWGAYRPRGWGGFWLRVARAMPGGWPWSRFALLARRVARGRLTGPVDTRVWGQRLRLFPDRSVSEARILFLPRSWDREERRRLGEWALAPGFTFVDIGANVGGYSFWVASRMAAGGQVVAVEPNPSLARQLRYNVRANGAGDRMCVVEAAVGAASGAGALTVGARNSGENRLVGVGERTEEATVPVRVATLADLVEEAGIDRIDCLKVDVEGREAEVIQPFLTDAPRAAWPKHLIVELKRPPGGGASRRAADGSAVEAGAANQRPGQVSAEALEEWLADRGYVRVLRTKLNGLFRLA
ncbi:MAG: FkbM family methyltransferase [Gemmatimonadota bacterium]|nr:FkbM family methyltransferase [Gemmatimonadota bacterium]